MSLTKTSVSVNYWEKTGESWTKYLWGHGHEAKTTTDLVPPPGLYPDYAKKRVTE